MGLFGNSMVMKAYKFRFYPNAKQKAHLAIEFGHSRHVWNWALYLKSAHYKATGKGLSLKEVSRQLTQYKKSDEVAWLAQASSTCLTQKLRDLETAFSNFFAGRARYPRSKKKRGIQSVRYQLDPRTKAWDAESHTVKLPKISQLGKLDVRFSQKVEGIPKMATVSMDGAGRYFISLACEVEIEHKPVSLNKVGIDCGITDVAVASDGFKSGQLTPLKKALYRLKILQRRLMHKAKGSNGYKRITQKIAKLHGRIRDLRQNFLHQLSYFIVHENQVIAVENLKVKNMLRNRRLSRALSDAAIGEFLRQLKYKAEWYGRQYVEIDPWFASSKTCACCGHKLDELKLSIRQWTCPSCNANHDRDINAARNILNEGIRLLTGVEAVGSTAIKRVESDTPSLAVA